MRARRVKRAVVLALASAGATVLPLALEAGRASAAASCDAADFTRNGVFNLEGYLACLGGDLPGTGSDSMRTVAVGAGLLVVGSGAVLGTRRRRSSVE